FRPPSFSSAARSSHPVLTLFRDFETRSLIDLTEVGAYRYAADPSTEVMCCSYAVNGDPVQLWTPGLAIPQEFVEAATNPEWRVVAHNDAFDSAIEKRFEWPSAPIERHICTAAMARAASYPGSLEGAAAALGLAERKDRNGARVMKQIATRKIEPTPE